MKRYLVMPMDEVLRFKDGIAKDSKRLRDEISAIKIFIEEKTPLEEDQLEFILHVFQSLYDYNSLKIKGAKRGRPSGTTAKDNMALYVYTARLRVINDNISERRAITETASINNMEFKTLEAAYYKEKEEFKHWDKEKQKTYMEAALTWYPLPEK